jgi:uncharacterized protein YaaN involved in tellurite resistance
MEDTNNKAIATLKGNVDYESFIANISDEEKTKFLEIAESIDINDKTTLQVYGGEINETISQSSEGLLSTVRSKNGDEIITCVNDTLAQLNMIDIDDLDPNNKFKAFLRTVPILRSLVKTVDRVLIQSDTIQENISKICTKMDAAKITAKKDNSTLESMLRNNDISINRLKELIVALKLKHKEYKQILNDMQHNPEVNHWDLQNMQNWVNSIAKKIADLEVTEHILSNNQFQIMAAQANNDAIIDKCENIINQVMPLWKNELSLAIVINKQKSAIDATKAVASATNKMMKATAKAVRSNSEDTARASEQTIVELETLKETQKQFVDMLKEVRRIHSAGEKNRESMERALVDMYNQTSRELTMIEAK